MKRGVSLIALTMFSVARAQDPATVGDWDPPFDLPLIAIHSAVLPTGKVLLFSAEHGVPGIHGWVLDPSTLDLTNVPPQRPGIRIAPATAFYRTVACWSRKWKAASSWPPGTAT